MIYIGILCGVLITIIGTVILVNVFGTAVPRYKCKLVEDTCNNCLYSTQAYKEKDGKWLCTRTMEYYDMEGAMMPRPDCDHDTPDSTIPVAEKDIYCPKCGLKGMRYVEYLKGTKVFESLSCTDEGCDGVLWTKLKEG